MQHSLIIENDVEGLNDFLMAGWKVVNTCAMPGSFADNRTPSNYHKIQEHLPKCLVVIEKLALDGNDNQMLGLG